jgi:Nucleotidyl transferase AbiEii toxin, Type IV TA system
MPYATPAALRAALEARLRAHGTAAAVDLERLRRRAVFERLLVRLDHAMPGQWVLKGGMALEVRLGDRARSTRDLDLAMRQAARDGETVRERLIEALAGDAEGDGFEFRIGPARDIDADEAGRPGWRFLVDARLDGRTFAKVRLDVVARPEEISATDRVRLPTVLAFAGFPDHEVEAVDPAQHFAEKLHAYTRPYGERPNSRVKDLPDLVLLLDGGLAPSAELLATVEHVFAARATHELPADLPDPPADWAGRYATLAEELDLAAATVDEAMALLRRFWATTLQARERPGPGPGLGRDGPGDPGGPG